MAGSGSSAGAVARLGEIVDLDRYPITDLAAPAGRALVEDCRSRFADAVLCELPGFVRQAAFAAVIADVEGVTPRAHLSHRHRHAYGFYDPQHGEVPEALGADDPRARRHRRHTYYLAYDESAADSVLHRLYESRAMAAFAAAVLDVPAIYQVADPLMAAPVSLHHEGCELGWHCDTQEFTLTVMFRPSEAGGIFEYVPLTGPRDASYDAVPAVFDGDRSLVRAVPIQAGSIVLFRGANTLHRVTPTRGMRDRILSVFHFERTPGRIYEDQFKLDVFGRAA